MEFDADLYQRLFDVNSKPTWVFDRATRRFLLVNDAAVREYGWSREEFLSMTVGDLRPPSDRPVFEAAFVAPKEGATYARVGRHWKKTGEVMEVDMQISCFTYRGREVSLAMVTNVTGIAEAERRFKRMVEHSTEAIAVSREDGTLEYVSPGGERILGNPAHEMIGKPSSIEIHPDDIHGLQPPAPFATVTQLARMRHRDGSWRWVESTTTNLLRDPAVRAYVTNYRDVTEQHEAQQALKRSEANFRALIERSQTATYVQRDGTIVYANPAAAALFGYEDASEMVGMYLFDLIHPDDREHVRARVQHTGKHGATPAGEGRMLRRDGSVFVAEAEAIRLEFDGVPSNVVFARDVTERRELFARIALADRMVTVGTLAAGVAHEINNPLSYVATNLEILDKRVQPPELRALVADAREGVGRVSAIVRDLRALAKPEDDVRRPIDVGAVLASSIKMASNQIRHRAMVVESFAADLPVVHANPSRLGQVFLNLLLNAAQAIPEGRADHNQIRVRARAEDGHVVIEIEDTGVGIAPPLMKRIFDPFFTTKEPGVGMGLGLAISHQIVRAMDGEITVTSTVGFGTTFRVTLPVSHVHAPVARASSSPPVIAGARILLVDDEPAVGRALVALLDGEHDVVPVVRAREALERLLAGEQYDVILCDLMMPEVSGIELYGNLPPGARERVVFMTGGAFTQQARDFLASCDRPQLDKPFTKAQLCDVVERVRTAP